MTRCYLCKKNSVQKAFDKLGWTMNRCNHCGLYSLDFKGNYTVFLKEYYDKKYFKGSSERAGYCNYEEDRFTEDRNMRAYVKRIRNFKQKGRLLDVGCATGLFMLQAKKRGFEVFGIDVSDYAVKIAKKRFGKRVKNGSIEKATYKKNEFDVIILYDVVEHLQDPQKVLVKLHNILKDDGFLVINTGDSGSFLAKIQGRDWHYFIPPQHFFCFSKKNLSELLRNSGFEVIHIDRKGKWLSLRYLFHLACQIQNDVFGKLGSALVRNNKLGKIPIYLNLFDNITVYATKIPERNSQKAK